MLRGRVLLELDGLLADVLRRSGQADCNEQREGDC